MLLLNQAGLLARFVFLRLPEKSVTCCKTMIKHTVAGTAQAFPVSLFMHLAT